MFSKEQFVQDCLTAAKEGQAAVSEIIRSAVTDPAGILSELGEPEHAGVFPLYEGSELTILNFAWAPYMNLMPHNHQMYAVIGIYTGREDNVFWKRNETGIEAAGAKSLGIGDVASLGKDAIHSVFNPIGKMTSAIHVYGGDFFDPVERRSEWDQETLTERPWDMERARARFKEADERFNAYVNSR